MRILHLTDLYPPVLGGLETQLEQLCRELASRGHEVDVVTLAHTGGPKAEVREGVRVHRIAGVTRILRPLYEDPRRPFHPTVPDPLVTAALAGIIRRRRPQVVHAHSWIVYSALPILPSRSVPLVLGLHDFGFICAKKTYLHHDLVCTGPKLLKCLPCASGQYGRPQGTALALGLAASRPWVRRADHVVANSRPVAEACSMLVAAGAPPIQVVPPFLPESDIRELQGPRPDFAPPTGPYIMFAGGAGVHKGLPVLLRAWDRLEAKVPLVVAGVTRGREPYPIPADVILAGQVPHDQVLRAWSHCAIATAPSSWPEPFGLVALEAMAAGRPVVATRSGNLADLVSDGVTGLLVPPDDPVALGAALARLLERADLREEMGKAAFQRSMDFRADAVVPRLEQVYRDAIRARTHTDPG